MRTGSDSGERRAEKRAHSAPGRDATPILPYPHLTQSFAITTTIIAPIYCYYNHFCYNRLYYKHCLIIIMHCRVDISFTLSCHLKPSNLSTICSIGQLVARGSHTSLEVKYARTLSLIRSVVMIHVTVYSLVLHMLMVQELLLYILHLDYYYCWMGAPTRSCSPVSGQQGGNLG